MATMHFAKTTLFFYIWFVPDL